MRSSSSCCNDSFHSLSASDCHSSSEGEMEVVLAEVEGSESSSSDESDAALGMLSYDWSDMSAIGEGPGKQEDGVVCSPLSLDEAVASDE